MSENETPENPESAAPPPPPEAPAPPPPPVTPDSAPAAAADTSNRTIMIVLSYLWILALIPLLVDKDDPEVQWHAKHGLVLTAVEIILQILFNAIAATGIGCIFAVFIPLVFLGFAIVRLLCIIKGINGERFLVPGISQYADKF